MYDLDALSREELIALIRQLAERVAALEEENLKLRQDPPAGAARAVPAFVKPSAAPKQKKTRRKRSQSFVRRREEPDEIIDHAVDRCADCGHRLSGGWVHRTREIIELPEAPVRVIHHRLLARRCGVCGRTEAASPDLSSEALGRHRVGVRLMSLIAQLHTAGRVPVRTIRRLLQTQYGLELGIGEISEVLHAVASKGEASYSQIKEAVRESPFVHADETGWREAGENGYLWSFTTPGLRYFLYDKSRAHHVPEGVLGEAYPGILASDFYAGYNYHLGLHQRCWVHFLRDLRELKEKNAQEPAVVQWAEAVAKVYEDARAFRSESRRERIRARERFQERLVRLGRRHARTEAPQSVMAERIMRFAQELFTFVEHPQVPPDNNAAERAIRPAVIARKVSGGTRSPKGSRTKTILMSLFGTWKAQGLDTLDACRRMLIAQPAPT